MNSLLKGLAIGFGVGAVIVGLFYAVVLIPKKVKESRGQKVVAVTRDIAEGEVLKQSDLGEAVLAKGYLWSDALVLTGDSRAVVGQRVTLALSKGDVLIWQAFARQDRFERVQACVQAVTPGIQEAGVKRGQQALEEFTQQAGPPLPGPPPAIADFPLDDKGETPVVVVTRKLSAGETLSGAALELRPMSRNLVTPSLVPGSALPGLTGASVVVPMEPGEPLRWQFIDHPERPRSLGACLGQVHLAASKEAERVAPEQVRAYLDKTPEGH